ncbi:uncharacterized protein HD556DRAFT_552159 [Suillus plorans]|uniref:Cytochrome P450 n=1 Tax=Suillus plorans TaxID=116603 RepID=A0A9P7DFZ9_9AGAM|nr:uncharacterized protein HD556DRAFT_552159 [Suillus plorans]KAG1792664.1 hypothetical protein HD556DRAFT_552159 [Suillus plorans]
MLSRRFQISDASCIRSLFSPPLLLVRRLSLHVYHLCNIIFTMRHTKIAVRLPAHPAAQSFNVQPELRLGHSQPHDAFALDLLAFTATETFLLTIMALYPDIQARARAEIDQAVKHDKMPCPDDRASMPYLDAILCEVLRWYHMTCCLGSKILSSARECLALVFNLPFVLPIWSCASSEIQHILYCSIVYCDFPHYRLGCHNHSCDAAHWVPTLAP